MNALTDGVSFGFLSSVLVLGERFKTNKFVFCWDGGSGKRKGVFKDYKLSRAAKTEEETKQRAELYAQFRALQHEVLPSLGFQNQIHQFNLEADDVIAQAIKDHQSQQFGIVSSDKDLLQLLRFKNCKFQHQPSSGKEVTAFSFLKEYRIPAREWAMVKAIAGCPTDGVPGIKGVGEKTAIKYILDELPDCQKRWAISESLELIQRNYRLVALPFKGTKQTQIKEDSLDARVVNQVFSDLGYESFGTGKQAERWGRFIRGEF